MAESPSLRWTGISETGRVRRENQDAWAVDPEAGVAVVADGVGGAPGGSVASRIAVRVLSDELAAAPWPDESGKARRQAALAAHQAVVQQWVDDPSLFGMATTLTAVRWKNGRVEGLHVGDSRAYHLHRNGLDPLTRDQTPAGEFLGRHGGEREVLRTHPQRHLLLQVVGGQEAPPDPDLFEVEISGEGDVIVLCSDGVDAAIPEPDFRTLLEPALSGDLDGALQAVVGRALQVGAPDNVTLVLGGGPSSPATDP